MHSFNIFKPIRYVFWCSSFEVDSFLFVKHELWYRFSGKRGWLYTVSYWIRILQPNFKAKTEAEEAFVYFVSFDHSATH